MPSISDNRFSLDARFGLKNAEAGPSRLSTNPEELEEREDVGASSGAKEDVEEDVEDEGSESEVDGLTEGMDVEGFAGPSGKAVKPLTREELAAFKAAQEKTGVVYISRIPPGMRPTKVRHLMTAYGEVGRVYLQPEDAKRSYLRRKYTSTKKIHFTEGWVEFKDKRVARSVAEMLNAQPIGGKKGTRWRDDIWTMKYLPKFKWNMLTEQIAHEAAMHAARLRVELSQSRREQHEYLRNVELARVLDKRAERKRKATESGVEASESKAPPKKPKTTAPDVGQREHKAIQDTKKPKAMPSTNTDGSRELSHVLGSIF
ncbi:RNA-binding ATPase activator esf2 [Steccherinum ochraceum]|uniref:18S rRNA factor 2 n=1 Tax=Steccherinum ochraceum TaxID=92696 RepID=A0A4R0R857_9APHY|nr:RNA-binding ATPase activator esf2 [Steccherinum ochraceum]